MPDWLAGPAVFVTVLIGMEGAAWALHKYVMHGPLWVLHASHHRPRHSWFELNDLFGIFFALISIGLALAGTFYNGLFLWSGMGMAGYGTTKLPKGEGMGVACVSSQERATASWTACVAHVAVAPSGEVKVRKLTVATDVGMQVHPDNIRAQAEGAALWGLSLAMYEKATLKDGGIEQTNFDTYTPLRMSQMPEVAVNVIANGDKPTGVGEPAVTVVAPAIGNAIFNACGARIRALPITAEAVKKAMKA